MAQGTRPRISAAEYLAQERVADEKHILWDGEVFAMAGASRIHNRLVASLLRELGVKLLGKPCQPYASDQRIHLPSAGRYVYPDASVTCEPVELDPLDEDTICNPRAIFEVLSESTERFDRGAKFAGYRSVPSLHEYVLLSQQEALVEHYTRHDDGSWVLRTFSASQAVRLPSLDIELAVEALYEDIDLAPASAFASGS